MQKILFFFIATFLCSLQLSAQLTLTQGNFTAAPNGEDSVSTYYGTTGIPANAATGGSNLSFDLSGINYFYTDTPLVLHLPYTGYTYQEFAVHPVKLPQLYYNARSLFNINVTGITKEGEKIDGRGYSLAGAPGASLTDSLIFPPQINLYSSSFNKIVFPATYKSVWSSSLQTSTTFTITYASIYNHTQCTYKSYITEKDSVIGYGKALVKTATNTTSDLIPVLQVRVRYHQTDSFFNGTTTPLDANTLTAFGLTQGQATDRYDHKFYRAGETTPLINISFADSTYSYQGINRTYVHTQRLTGLGLPEYTTENAVNIYPNPITSHIFTLQVQAGYTGRLAYRIVNIDGREIAAGNIANPGKAALQLPAAATPGVYQVQVYIDGKLVCVKPVTVQ